MNRKTPKQTAYEILWAMAEGKKTNRETIKKMLSGILDALSMNGIGRRTIIDELTNLYIAEVGEK